MPVMNESTDMSVYLESSPYIDWQHPDVLQKARDLANGQSTDEAIANACFCFVRDEVPHSWYHKRNPVTCAASDVLAHGTGYCYVRMVVLPGCVTDG